MRLELAGECLESIEGACATFGGAVLAVGGCPPGARELNKCFSIKERRLARVSHGSTALGNRHEPSRVLGEVREKCRLVVPAARHRLSWHAMYDPFDSRGFGRVIQGDFATGIPSVQLERQADSPRQRGMIGTSWKSGRQTPTVRCELRPDSQGIVHLPNRFLYSLGNRTAPMFLPQSLQAKFEDEVGHDLSKVRIHVGSEPDAIGAKAFAIGNNVHILPDEYRPSSADGMRLLAHEVAHVVQQSQGQVRHPGGSGLVIVQALELEAEAERFAERVVGKWGASTAFGSILQPAKKQKALDKKYENAAHNIRVLCSYGSAGNEVTKATLGIEDKKILAWVVNSGWGDSKIAHKKGKKGSKVRGGTNEELDRFKDALLNWAAKQQSY